MNMKHIYAAATAVSLLITTVPARAQQVKERAVAPEEIIVTARKRQESILTVPIVTTVLTQAQLENRSVRDLAAVATLTPGLIIGQNYADTGTQVSIRGVGTSIFNPGMDQSISLNLDGLQISQGTGYRSALFDMQQIEVLKGPQALFFGKSSPGGVVSVRTADPGKTFEIIARIGHEFVAKETRGELIFSGPLTDAIGVRLAAMYDESDGYFRNKAVGVPSTGSKTPPSDWGRTTALYVRGTVLYEGSSGFSARLKVNYARDRLNGSTPFQLVSCPDGLGNYAGVPFFSPNEDCKADRDVNIASMVASNYVGMRNNGDEFTHQVQKFGTLELNYDFSSDLTLTSVTGYYVNKLDALFGVSSGNAGPALVTDKHFSRRDTTQEVRLNSNYQGPVNFTLGGFYQDGRMTDLIYLFGNPSYRFPRFIRIGDHDIRIDSLSFFGQARYKPTPQVEIAAGARWTNEKRNDNVFTVDLFGAFGGGPGSIVYPRVPRLNTKNWSPEVTISYLPTDDLTIFGSFKQAYKSGSYSVTPINPGVDNSFGDEKVQGGELGVKARLADRQIYTNLAGYYYVYTGLQVGASEAITNSAPSFRTLNAGSAKVYGIDFDMNYRPISVPGLSMRAAINWNHARFTKFNNAVCAGGQTVAEGCNQALNPLTGLFTSQSLAGVPLQRAPAWQINLGADYEMEFADGYTLVIGADSQYSSKFLADLGRRDDFYQKAFAKINSHISVRGKNDAWEVSLIGTNLSDKLSAGTCSNSNYAGGSLFPGIVTGGASRGAAGSDELFCAYERGREIWIRVTLRPLSFND